MMDEIIESTDKYVALRTKEERKKIGQFFTSKETANFMAKLSTCQKENLKILDAGAGTGILSVALLEKLNKNNKIKNIDIDLYENDQSLAQILENNMNIASKKISKIKKCRIIKDNFILHSKDVNEKYDIVISNPPYKKIGKSSCEAMAMKDIVHGQPNMYFLFMAMSERLLKNNGELIFIVPRSWTSGAYFKKFRQEFLENVKISNIHLFMSRDKVFSKEDVLQETIILRAEKTKKPKKKITITESYGNDDFNKINKYEIDYDICVEKEGERYVYLPTTESDVKTLQMINKFNTKLNDIGLKLKTGLTVDFRNETSIEKVANNNNVPLLSSIHFKDGIINFPSQKNEPQYIKKDNQSLLQKNTNYLFIKRFSSKEESRRIQPAMFFRKQYSNYDYISTENHINFICSIDNKELQEDLIYGLYGIYNSTLYDKYYRILNGSTQVNATEINNIPIPNEKELKEIGKHLRERRDISTKSCNNILMEVLSNE